MLPKDFPCWKLVYYYFTSFKNTGIIEFLHDMIHQETRVNAGKESSPSLGIIYSQSFKTTSSGGESRGIDGGKKVKGNKQHLVVDNMGLVMSVKVHAVMNMTAKQYWV